MACASQIPAHKISDKGPGTEMYSKEDKDLLQQPFALAVLAMGYDRLDLILYATKLLQSQKRPLQAPTVMVEVEELQEMERKGKKFPPLPQKTREKDDLGSAGESDEESNGGSLEYYDADDGSRQASTGKSDDLETDCAEPEQAVRAEKLCRHEPEVQRAPRTSPSLSKAVEMQRQFSRKGDMPKEPKRKLDNGKDLERLKLKLQVLRSENKRLKERQLCRDCHSRPVSITFLPCGHYSYCYDCGQRFAACPICRKTILADVRTFLA